MRLDIPAITCNAFLLYSAYFTYRLVDLYRSNRLAVARRVFKHEVTQ